MTTLSDFISKVKTTGLSKTNKYMVFIGKPKVITAGSSSKLDMICMFCDQIQLPGLNFASIGNRTYGEYRETPYEKMYEGINLSFYVDSNLEVKYFFDQWVGGMQSNYDRQWAFYKDYITDIEINVINDQNDRVYSVKLYEAYPKNISPIQMDYSGKDIMKLQVAINYKYWRSSIVGYTKNAESYKTGIAATDGGFNYTGFLSTQGLIDLEQCGFNIPNNYFTNFTDFQTVFTDQFGQVKEEVSQSASLSNSFRRGF